MHVFIVKRSKNINTPAGELINTPAGMILHYDDFMLMRIIKALASKSLCSKHKEGNKTHKKLTDCKFREILARIKRPYFFDNLTQHPWKHTERL